MIAEFIGQITPCLRRHWFDGFRRWLHEVYHPGVLFWVTSCQMASCRVSYFFLKHSDQVWDKDLLAFMKPHPEKCAVGKTGRWPADARGSLLRPPDACDRWECSGYRRNPMKKLKMRSSSVSSVSTGNAKSNARGAPFPILGI